MGRTSQPSIFRVPLIQLAVLLLIGVVVLFYSTVVAYSFLLGGCIHLLPNTVFTSLVFQHWGARTSQQVYISLWRGEAWKFFLSALGFILVFTTIEPLNIATLFGAYILMVVVGLFTTVRVLQAKEIKRPA